MKKLLSLLLCIIMVASFINIWASWEKEGWFGDDATYHYNSETGVFTVEGTGVATRYSNQETGEGFTDAEYAEFMSNAWRIREVIIGEGITELYHSLFWHFTDISKVTLPSTLRVIEGDVFYYTKSLTEITLPDGLEKIGGEAFAESGITKINLPEGLKEIGYRAFNNTPLTEIHIPASVEKIDYNAFGSDKRTLEKITVSPDNPYFTSVDGVLYNKDMTTLICYPSGKTDLAFTVPESVKTIGEYSFVYSNLVEININEGTEMIESSAFDCSDKLEAINFPSTLKTIRQLGEIKSVKKLVIPKGVESYYSGWSETLVDTVHKGDLPNEFSCYCGRFHHHSESFTWWDNPGSSRICQKIIDNPDTWAEAEINKAREEGILPESLDCGYKSRITRAEFAHLVVALTEKAVGHSLPLAEENFADTHSASVSKAKAAGIVSGRGGNLYSPGSYVTREEIAVMFLRTINYIEKEKGTILIEKKDFIDKKYEDRDKVSSWAVNAMATLSDADIIKGSTIKTLFPSGTATMQESILMAGRVFNLIG